MTTGCWIPWAQTTNNIVLQDPRGGPLGARLAARTSNSTGRLRAPVVALWVPDPPAPPPKKGGLRSESPVLVPRAHARAHTHAHTQAIFLDCRQLFALCNLRTITATCEGS